MIDHNKRSVFLIGFLVGELDVERRNDRPAPDCLTAETVRAAYNGRSQSQSLFLLFRPSSTFHPLQTHNPNRVFRISCPPRKGSNRSPSRWSGQVELSCRLSASCATGRKSCWSRRRKRRTAGCCRDH